MRISKEQVISAFKKYYQYILVSVIFLFLGLALGFFFNSSYGTIKEKVQYIDDFVQSIIEKNTEIIEVPIECNCPECSKDLEVEDNNCPIKVDVSGAVKNPGVYCFQENSVIMDAVDEAGGFQTDYGYKYIYRKINLAQKLVNGQKIYFPYEEDLSCELFSFSQEAEEFEAIIEPDNSSNEESSDNSENSSDETSCISINNAGKEQLMTLTGVGEATAEKIINGRPYEILDDLLDVKGIGDATFEKIKNDICL